MARHCCDFLHDILAIRFHTWLLVPVMARRSEDKTMKWTHHYTGIDTAEASKWGFTFYMTRDSKTRSITFLRLSFPKLFLFGRHMLGVFIGPLNYASLWGQGFEVFSNKWRWGWLTQRNTFQRNKINWSGSSAMPNASIHIRLGRFFIGREAPRWLRAIQDRRDAKKWERIWESIPGPCYDNDNFEICDQCTEPMECGSWACCHHRLRS